MTDPDDGAETTAAAPAEDPREYRWSLLAAVVLSLATLASAWCGYQASSWGSVYSTESRAANGHRLEAGRQSAVADRQTINDVLLFTSWVEADLEGNQKLADEIADRFQPHFLPAFEAWLEGPVTRGHLPDGSPFGLEEYRLPTQQQADDANAQAAAAIERADHASALSSRYVLSTVLFASVLFLAGIASKLSQPRIVHAVVLLAGLTLAGAIVAMVVLPVQL
ncbi:MAG TPA: hypothetical protein PJ992_02490 [Arachnia sp.]|nr:hypothetical protein [Arachnia sp.]HMR13576.1 hypothetical protein [Arachnia sp.]